MSLKLDCKPCPQSLSFVRYSKEIEDKLTIYASIKEFKCYEKQVLGHRIQVDIKFLKFEDKNSDKIRRFQYTVIDGATRARALKIYDKHNQ